MQSRLVNLILLGLNIGCLGIIAFLVFLLKERQGPPPFLYTPRPVTNTVTQIAVRKINATNLLALLASRQVSWANLESTNYFLYVANLRAFGVPEETIRDIIIADVHKVYSQRRAELRAQAPQPKFWQTGSAWEETAESALPAELRAQLRAADQEERDLLQQLLGIDPGPELARFNPAPGADFERKYGFLPPEKRDRLAAALARYDELEQELLSRTKGLLLDEDYDTLRQLAQARESDLAQLLSPEELEEYQLRNSSTAHALRYSLDGFNPSEEEFRKLFHLQKAFDDQFGDTLGPLDEKQMEARALAQQEAQQALAEEVKKALGEERFAEWQRIQDDSYKTLLQVAGRFDLPREAAGQVYDMKRAAERQKEMLEADPNITEEQRQAAVLAIAQETERAVAQALGDKAFMAYRKAAGDWLTELAFVPPPEPPPPVQVQQVPVAVPFNPPGIPPPPATLFPPLPPGVFPPQPNEVPR
jgi:hypothetical protein